MSFSISINDLMSAPGVIIDVRSPGEYLEAHIPGASNLPLFDNNERAEVGTLYKQVGADEARKRALAIVQPKMVELINGIFNLVGQKVPSLSDEQVALLFEKVSRHLKVEGDDGEAAAVKMEFPENIEPLIGGDQTGKKVVVYCWRGGARSKSVFLLARLLGLNSFFVEGGHKAYRNTAQKFLNQNPYPFQVCTVYGLTGSGKTKLLQKWQKEGNPVIDLEGLAHHRGSAFGQVGIEIKGRQTDFENNLFWQCWHWAQKKAKFIVVEGESRRIGNCVLPEAFMAAMVNGKKVKMDVAIDERVANILKEYVGTLDDRELYMQSMGAIDSIKKRLGGELHHELSGLLLIKDYFQFTKLLLERYYDKLYQDSRGEEKKYIGTLTNDSEFSALSRLLIAF